MHIHTANLAWRDGLPFSSDFDDIYFSFDNALHEVEHVFINGNDLPGRWRALHGESRFIIAETGFGTGLNFLLCWSLWKKYAPATAHLHFISSEKHPLTLEDLKRCHLLWPALKDECLALQRHYPLLTPGFHYLPIEHNVSLMLMLGDAETAFQQLLVSGDARLEERLRTFKVDAWFLDGFAPAKNPDMWSEKLMQAIGLLSAAGTTLATFSAAGHVRRMLEGAGFSVVKKKGYGRKREMITASWSKSVTSCKMRHTPWHMSKPPTLHRKHAIIIGAGLAGCCNAFALSRRGWSVSLIDSHGRAGAGASGNRQAVLYPKLSAFCSPHTNFMLHAFLYASRFYQSLLDQRYLGELKGILQLAHNQKEVKNQASLTGFLNQYPGLGKLVGEAEAGILAGIDIQVGGLYVPNAGWMDSLNVCRYLLELSDIQEVVAADVSEIQYENGFWHAGSSQAEILILTNGFGANRFKETSHLPLKPIRGQLTALSQTPDSAKINIPICAEGHVLPAREGCHFTGATYHLGVADNAIQKEDDLYNLNRLKRMPVNTLWSDHIMGNWCGVRMATPDYLPLVGPVPKEQEFVKQFASLATNAKGWIASPGIYYPGLYICTGFGSRGLTSIPLCAEFLAALLNNEPCHLPRNLIQALSPARFLIRDIIRSRNVKN